MQDSREDNDRGVTALSPVAPDPPRPAAPAVFSRPAKRGERGKEFVNRADGFVDIARPARPVGRNPLNVGVLTQSDEHPVALGGYPNHADTGPRRLFAHAHEPCGRLSRHRVGENPQQGDEVGRAAAAIVMATVAGEHSDIAQCAAIVTS